MEIAVQPLERPYFFTMPQTEIGVIWKETHRERLEIMAPNISLKLGLAILRTEDIQTFQTLAIQIPILPYYRGINTMQALAALRL